MFLVSYALLWILTLALAIGYISLLRSRGGIRGQTQTGPTTNGNAIGVRVSDIAPGAVLPAGDTSVVVLATHDCPGCRTLLRGLATEGDLGVPVAFFGAEAVHSRIRPGDESSMRAFDLLREGLGAQFVPYTFVVQNGVVILDGYVESPREVVQMLEMAGVTEGSR